MMLRLSSLARKELIMSSQRILTGITPSGVPHIGNYVGMFKPALARQHEYDEALYFIADYHSLVKLWDAKARQEFVLQVAATWLALGLDPNKVIFYRQSQMPEIAELNWILTSIAAKGLLNRAHAYKDKTAKNIAAGHDADAAITMGLYCYPILMTADILAFNADVVPVGQDQLQHIEIARDIAVRFNHLYKTDLFVVPASLTKATEATIPGLDGRKMSKSYNNTIPLFLSSKQLRKMVMKIVTNSQIPGEPKQYKGDTLYQIYRAFAIDEEVTSIEQCYRDGIAWGEMKQILFEKMDSVLAEPRKQYEYYLMHSQEVFDILQQGEVKAREIAHSILQNVKAAIGII